MLITIITILGIAILIVAHEWGHFWAAKKFDLKVEEFGVGFPPRIWSKKKGETLYSFNWLPLGGFVKIAGEGEGEEALESISEAEKKRLFVFQKPWKKAVIVSAGIVMNVLVGWLILFSVFLVGTPRGIVISSVQKGSPAEAVGLKVNDIILGYGEPGQRIDKKTGGDDRSLTVGFIAFVRAHQGQSIQLLVRRGEAESMVAVVPSLVFGEERGALGVYLTEVGIPRQNVWGALQQSFSQSIGIIRLTVESFLGLVGDIFTQAKISEGVVGPVGIFAYAYETGKINLIYLLQLLSIISLNLAVLNLIPLPALDGGHLLFIAIEKLKGSPIRDRTKLIANATGLGLLGLLALIITFRDVRNIFFS